MFAENISGNVLKYDTVCQFSKIFIKIFERTFQSVTGEDKLGKCSFKYFDIWREIVFEMVSNFFFQTYLSYQFSNLLSSIIIMKTTNFEMIYLYINIDIFDGI